MDIRIMTPGMKLKELRKKLGIKQYELAGNKITRNLISMLENDKANITKDTAVIFSENINDICRERHLDFNIEPEYFMDTVKKQLENLFNQVISVLKKSDIDYIKENHEKDILSLEDLLIKYGEKEKKYNLYKLLGDKYYNNNEYEQAYTYYIKANENAFNEELKEDYYNFLLMLSSCCIMIKKYKESMYINNQIIIYREKITEELAYKVVFNNVLCYKNIGDYKETLNELEVLKKGFFKIINNNIKYKFQIETIEGNSLREISRFNEAIKKYKNLIEFLDGKDLQFKLVTVCNLIETYIKINDKKNIKLYLDKSLLLIDEYEKLDSKEYSVYIYNDIALAAKEIGEINVSIEYFNKCMRESKNFKTALMINNSFEELLNIYIILSDEKKIEELKNEFLEAISLKLLKENNKLSFKFIDYYNSIRDFDTINQLIKYILKL